MAWRRVGATHRVLPMVVAGDGLHPPYDRFWEFMGIPTPRITYLGNHGKTGGNLGFLRFWLAVLRRFDRFLRNIRVISAKA